MNSEISWLIVGFIGQTCFTSRFLVQWLVSEQQKKSIIPIVFWYFSILGGATLLIYALHQKDPVFILGQSTGLIIYLRNLFFIHRETERKVTCAKTS